MTEKDYYEYLNDTPGPSPWYLEGKSVSTDNLNLSWQEINLESLQGKLVLKDVESIYAIVNMYTWTYKVKNYLVVWYQDISENDSTAIEIELYDMNKIKPIDDLSMGQKYMQDKKKNFYCPPALVASFSIPTNQDQEIYSIHIPNEFKIINELLIIGNRFSEVCLFVVDLKHNITKVYPQDWFNKGDTDFGYQWITRITRLKNKIIGDGIRIGIFELDNKYRNISKWLVYKI